MASASVSVDYFDTSKTTTCVVSNTDAATAWFTSNTTVNVNVGSIPSWTSSGVISTNVSTNDEIDTQVLNVVNFLPPASVQLSPTLQKVQRISVFLGVLGSLPAESVASNNLLVALTMENGNVDVDWNGSLPDAAHGFTYTTNGSSLQISGPEKPTVLPVVTFSLVNPVTATDGLQVSFTWSGMNSFAKWNYGIQAVYFGPSDTTPLYTYSNDCISNGPSSSPGSQSPGSQSPGSQSPGSKPQTKSQLPVWAIVIIVMVPVLAIAFGLGFGLASKSKAKLKL